MTNSTFILGALSISIALTTCVTSVSAQTKPSAKTRCDSNGDGFITGSEVGNLARLQVSEELQAYDQNCDGVISAAELEYINQRVAEALDEDGGFQEDDLIFQSQTSPIEVGTDEAPENEPAQRLFLSKNRVTPSLSPLTRSGATFSFTDDAEAGEQTLNVDGVLTYLLLDPDRKRSETSSLSGLSFATYLDLNGTVNSGADDTTSATVGIDAFLDFEATGAFDRQTLQFGPYFQTDFEGDAEIYGLSASWTPVRIDWQLGSGRTGTGDLREHFLWFVSGNVDYRNVKETGETQLDTGEQFWAGFSLGAKIYPFNSIGSATPHLELGLDTRRNISNGDDATLGSVAINFPLTKDPENTSAFVVSYENGESYRTGEQIDKTTIGFSFKF